MLGDGDGGLRGLWEAASALKEEAGPLLASLKKCDAGLVDFGRTLELGYGYGGSEEEGEGGAKARSSSSAVSVSLVQSMHRFLAKARFNLGMFAFFAPWAGAIALSGLATAAVVMALFPVTVVLEVVFYVFMSRRRRGLLLVSEEGTKPICKEECVGHMKQVQESMVDLARDSPGLATAFLSDWFRGGDPGGVTRADALEWMSQNFMFRDYCDLETEAERETVHEVVDVVEDLFGHEKLLGSGFKFQEGGRRMQCLKSGFSVYKDYETRHYPLSVYLGIRVFKQLAEVLVGQLGFERHEGSGLTYWLRGGGSRRGKGARPIVFFHGIGTGVSSYAVILKALCIAYPDSSIMMVELPLVAMEMPWGEGWIAERPTSSEETLCKPLLQVLLKHELLHRRPVVMGHSFGCFACRWVLNHKELARCLGGCVLLDPLVFLLPYPDISKRLEGEPKTFYEFFVRKIIMREPGVAFALNRKSKWPKCCLWQKDLEDIRQDNADFKVAIALSKRDCFFDVTVVERHLKKKPWQHHETYDCTHGELIFRPDLICGTMKMIHFVM
ncbi:hypothetical protein HOP50_18g81150 [Chloropicon primus]|uniref:AB hydrolase-1 domain-containing protein n=3 Tax=Chloropicon primus TaxID=1764295 RepID=A0A5B8MY83_9CHLO|nr:hypothetical protein A3770_18p80910 [Chloropicon primus]UPR04770.1 hypothetical protein HOP50_18g81150 [Chloropicon primus]|eukprot:QDZ25573.1 hypothetical protein A3770_18p80910 [Chloropicon primus]